MYYRYQSKSQADLLASQSGYENSSVSADIPDFFEQKSFSYATLPRKKRVTSPTNGLTPVKPPHADPNDLQPAAAEATNNSMLML